MWDEIINKTCWFLCKSFPDRTRTVPCPKDPSSPLLTQFVIVPEKLYLQHFNNPNDKDYHDHRWDMMRSFVLSGHYVEERPFKKFFTRKAFNTHKMTVETKHRVHSWSSKCWTLFYMRKVVKNDWGYYKGKNMKFIPWYEYIPDNNKIPHIETGEVTKYNKDLN